MYNDITPGVSISITQEQENRVEVSRTDIARQRRATDDLKMEAERLEKQITRALTNSHYVSDDDVKKIIKKRNELNKLNNNIQEFTQNYTTHSNISSNLSENEKDQIYHLYKTGLYTQIKLANQFGVTQAAISKICNR